MASLLGCIAALSCSSDDAVSTLAGTPCDPACTGPGCDGRCDGTVLLSCGESGVWMVLANCAADGLVCRDDASSSGPACSEGSSDAGGAGGTENGGSGATTSGGTPSGGSGAIGGSNARSPGTTSISFSVGDGGDYCRQNDTCSTGPGFSIEDEAGRTLTLSPGFCPTMCSDCVAQPCPGMPCVSQGVPVTGASFTWDGTIYPAATCGEGTACVIERYAPPGAYRATFCATPGVVQTPGTNTESECVASGPEECVSVDFLFGTVDAVSATLGTGSGSGGAGTGGAGTGGSGAAGSGTGGSSSDPLCADADSNGFFSTCDACLSSDCDLLDLATGQRQACGCSSSACPCGLTCGSFQIVPGVSVGGLCVR